MLQSGGGNDYFETPLTNAGLVETTNGFLEIGNATPGGTFEANGGNLALVGVYAAAAEVTDTVDFVGATLGWYGDGAANLTGPGTVVSTGMCSFRIGAATIRSSSSAVASRGTMPGRCMTTV